MRHYVIVDAGGVQSFSSSETGFLPKGAIEVPRQPGSHECWDIEAGNFTYDAQGHADDLAGPEHISAMRMQKAIEARLIAGGVVVPTMLLAREAELRGVDVAELARIVNEKAAASLSIELDRQAAGLDPNVVRARSTDRPQGLGRFWSAAARLIGKI